MLQHPPTRIYRNWVADSRRWDAYRPRAGDVVIATYPKSGTTWMQQIVSLLIFQSTAPRPIAEIAPWFEMRALARPAEAIMADLDAQTQRRFIKCHVPFDGMPIYDEVKYIHVARDGRDACLSYHNHCLAFGEPILAAFDDIGLADETIRQTYPRAPSDASAFFLRWLNEGIGGELDGSPFGSWFSFEKTFWAARAVPNVLMVHYRDLKSDLVTEMRRIATFLDISVPRDLWPDLVNAATFAEMRRVGSVLQPTIERVLVGGASRFFQYGENDRWNGVLTSADIELYEDRVRRSFEPDCAAWLHHGRHAHLSHSHQQPDD